MLPESQASQPTPRGERILKVASSEKLPLETASVKLVLASPPYCTRIDYAVATSAELSLLGVGLDLEFKQLRHDMIGSATVPRTAPMAADSWGETCLTFLGRLERHGSKASATYYHKNHLQYFQSISDSISEISRVLKPDGKCVLVVQDSYYKDLHNDLPTTIAEMGFFRNLVLCEKCDFPLSRTMAGINPAASSYRTSFNAIESVLIFRKSRSLAN
jgi:hypothetical protein